jgi:hypothetical protein
MVLQAISSDESEELSLSPVLRKKPRLESGSRKGQGFGSSPTGRLWGVEGRI